MQRVIGVNVCGGQFVWTVDGDRGQAACPRQYHGEVQTKPGVARLLEMVSLKGCKIIFCERESWFLAIYVLFRSYSPEPVRI